MRFWFAFRKEGYRGENKQEKDFSGFESPVENSAGGKGVVFGGAFEILKFLIEKSANINEIAAHFGIPQSSAALHVKVLEEAGMISVIERPGVRGTQKVCRHFL